MEKITVFNQQTCKLITSAISDKLKRISDEMEAEYGVKVALSTASGTFGDKEFTKKLSIILQGVDLKADAQNEEINDFKLYCRGYDLKPEDLNRKFRHKNSQYELVGFKSSRRTYPFVCKNLSTGKVSLFPINLLKLCLK